MDKWMERRKVDGRKEGRRREREKERNLLAVANHGAC